MGLGSERSQCSSGRARRPQRRGQLPDACPRELIARAEAARRLSPRAIEGRARTQALLVEGRVRRFVHSAGRRRTLSHTTFVFLCAGALAACAFIWVPRLGVHSCRAFLTVLEQGPSLVAWRSSLWGRGLSIESDLREAG